MLFLRCEAHQSSCSHCNYSHNTYYCVFVCVLWRLGVFFFNCEFQWLVVILCFLSLWVLEIMMIHLMGEGCVRWKMWALIIFVGWLCIMWLLWSNSVSWKSQGLRFDVQLRLRWWNWFWSLVFWWGFSSKMMNLGELDLHSWYVSRLYVKSSNLWIYLSWCLILFSNSVQDLCFLGFFLCYLNPL